MKLTIEFDLSILPEVAAEAGASKIDLTMSIVREMIERIAYGQKQDSITNNFDGRVLASFLVAEGTVENRLSQDFSNDEIETLQRLAANG